jgi:hypothetical protein
MIDEMSETMSQIENQTEAKHKTLEIAKNYALNYTCSLNKKH